MPKFQNITYIKREIQSNLKETPFIPHVSSQNSMSLPKTRPLSGFLSRNRPISEEVRNNPFADLPKLSSEDLNKGLFTLINQGFLPKDVNLTPNLLKSSGFRLKSARIHARKEVSFGKNQKELFITEKNNREINGKNKVFQKKFKENPESLAIKAILTIQAFWKAYRIRKNFKRCVFLMKKVQRIIKKIVAKKRLSDLLEKNKKEMMKKYEEIQKKINEDWKFQKHIEILINTSNDQVYFID